MTTQTAFVFGSTPSTLLTARLLELQSYSVKIFDPGNHFNLESPHFLTPEVAAIPATDYFRECLTGLAKAADTEVQIETNDLSPITWGDNQFEGFLGFGDRKYNSIPALSRHHLNSSWVISPTLNSLFLDALRNFKGETIPFSEVSKLNCSASSIDSVEINGAKTLEADLYVFAQSPREMIPFLPSEFLSERDWTKLNRSPSWSKLTIEVPVTCQDWAANQNCFLLPNSNDFEPWIGLPGQTPSIWVSYLPEDKTENPEAIGAEIRQLKKLLSKVFPGLDENAPEPGIHLDPEAAGSYAWMESGQKIENSLEKSLFVSEILSDYAGLAASMDSSFKALERLLSLKDNPTQSRDAKPTILDSNPLP
jgi:hypothetical protein